MLDPAGTLEALSRTFLDSALDCIITMDATGRVQEFNPAAERVFGFTRSEAVGKELAELIIPPRLRERHREGLARYLKTGEGPLIGKLIEIEALRRDGSEIMVALAINATQVNGSPIFTAYLRDITERKRAEETNRRLAAIIESSGDAIISKDLDEIVTSWNNGAERLFGCSADEIIGKPIAVLVPPDRHDEELGIIDRLRQGKPVLRYETVYLRKDGTTLDVSLAVSPIKDEIGNIIGASKIARDITERVRTERRRTTQYAVTNLLAASWTLAEVANELLEAMASSGDWAFAAIWTYDEATGGLALSERVASGIRATEKVLRFVSRNYASRRPGPTRTCLEFKETNVGLRRHPRSKFPSSSVCGSGGFARWICFPPFLSRQDRRHNGAV